MSVFFSTAQRNVSRSTAVSEETRTHIQIVNTSLLGLLSHCLFDFVPNIAHKAYGKFGIKM